MTSNRIVNRISKYFFLNEIVCDAQMGDVCLFGENCDHGLCGWSGWQTVGIVKRWKWEWWKIRNDFGGFFRIHAANKDLLGRQFDEVTYLKAACSSAWIFGLWWKFWKILITHSESVCDFKAALIVTQK